MLIYEIIFFYILITILQVIMSTSKDSSSHGIDSDPDVHIEEHKAKMEELEKQHLATALEAPTETKTDTTSAMEEQNRMTNEEFDKLMNGITEKYPSFEKVLQSVERTPTLVRTKAFKLTDKQPPPIPPSLAKLRQEAAEAKKLITKRAKPKHDKTRPTSPNSLIPGLPTISQEHDELYAEILQNKRQERIDKELQTLSDKFEKWDISQNTIPCPLVKLPPVRPISTTIQHTPQQAIKADIETNRLLAEQAKLMTRIVQALGTHTETAQLNEIKKQTVEHAEKAIKIRTETSRQEEMLKRSAVLTEKYQKIPRLPAKVPRTETPMVYLPKDVEAACGTYNPDDPKADFAKTWDNLLFMGKDNGYQTEDYLKALGYILKGDAKEVYNQCRANNEELEDILQRLTNAYAKQRTVTEDRRALDNFSRKPNEPLLQCMSRCDILIDKLQPFHTPEAWNSVREFFKRMALLQVVSKQTKRKILFMEDDTIKATGLPCDTTQLISYADTYEARHEEIPQTEIKTVFHCANVEPAPKHDPMIKQMAKQIQQLKDELSNVSTTVTAFSTATQDVSMTDQTVRPNKRPRSDDTTSTTKATTSSYSQKPTQKRFPPSSDELRRQNSYPKQQDRGRSDYRSSYNKNSSYSNNKQSDTQSKTKQYDSDKSPFYNYYNSDKYSSAKTTYNKDYYKRDGQNNKYYNKDYKQKYYNKDGYSDYRNRQRSEDRSRAITYSHDKKEHYRNNRSSSYDKYFNRKNQKQYKRDFDTYIIPDANFSSSMVPYKRHPEVKQEGSGNIIFNMEGQPVKLIKQSDFMRQLRHSEN